jgi:hypothetical protein
VNWKLSIVLLLAAIVISRAGFPLPNGSMISAVDANRAEQISVLPSLRGGNHPRSAGSVLTLAAARFSDSVRLLLIAGRPGAALFLVTTSLAALSWIHNQPAFSAVPGRGLKGWRSSSPDSHPFLLTLRTMLTG